MKHTLKALGKPETLNSPEECIKTMARYKELGELQQAMAKRAGDRVVLK